jgi:hypothetical protein
MKPLQGHANLDGRRVLQRPVAWFCLTLFASKALVVCGILAAFAFEYDHELFNRAYANWSTLGSLESRLATWDSAHYLKLSAHGYEAGSPSCAFYPLWPCLINLATPLVAGNRLAAAFLLANGLSVAALWLFHGIVEQRHGTLLADDSLALMLSFPGALFFSFPYTESLFLLLVMIFFNGIGRGRYFGPGIACVLLPLTKAMGVFILVPLAWHICESRNLRRCWPLLGLPVLGYATYFWIMWLTTGDALAGFAAQSAYPNAPSVGNMVDFHAVYNAFLNMITVGGMMNGVIDRVLFLALAVLLPVILRFDKAWFLYAACMGIVPALTGWFMSYRRFVIVVFPLFIVIAYLLRMAGSRLAFWYYAVFLACLQFWAVIQFVNFRWAG